MADLILDSGYLNYDWVGIFGSTGSGSTGYSGAKGGSGIIEIYYLTPTTILPPLPVDPGDPTIVLSIGNLIEIEQQPFLLNTLNIDNAIGQRGIATFQTMGDNRVIYSTVGDFLNGGTFISTDIDTDPNTWPVNGDRIVFTGAVPDGIERDRTYYVVGVLSHTYWADFQIALAEGGSPLSWTIPSALRTAWDIVSPYAFSIGQNLVFHADGVPVWSGVIERINKKLPTSTGILYYIQGVSWNYALDKRRIVASYTQTSSATSTSYGGSSSLTAGFIVEELIDNYLAGEGISTGVISSGATLNSAAFNYIKPSQCLDTLAEQSGYIWQVNPDKTLDFKPHDLESFSFNLGSTWMKEGSIQYTRGSPKYRNVQYVVGGIDLTSTQNEYQYGDGKKMVFPVPYMLMQAPNLYVIAGGTSSQQSVGILGVDSTYQWYWNKYSNLISQTATGTALTTAQQVHVEYIGGFPSVARAESAAAINELREWECGTGIVEDAILTGEDTIYDDNIILAENLITKYSTVCDTLKFKTLRSGISPGKILKIDLPDFNLSSEEFLVDSVSIRDQDGKYLWYDVTCLSGSEHGGWSRFFDDFITRTVEKDIWEGGALQGDVLIVSQAYSETGSWTSVISSTDKQCLTPSATLYPASSNYPC